MDRTNAANNIDIGGGRRGHRDRNTAAGLAGTRLSAEFMNGLQEEMLALIESTGQVANSADSAQVNRAVTRLTGAQLASVTANTVLTADSGLVIVNAASGPVVITLPAANALAGTLAGVATVRSQPLTLVRIDTSGNAVTVARAGSDKLGRGTAVNYLLSVGEVLRIASDGVDTWRLVSCNLLGRRRTVLTSAGNFTVPAWVDWVRAKGTAAGGGGGGCPAGGTAGGGGAGGTFDGELVVTPGAVMAATVGTGGAGGVGSANGGNGGNTTFGGMTANGGSGGSSSGLGSPAGGAGGTATGGVTNVAGGYGTDGIGSSVAGSGGASAFGGGGRGSSGGGSPAAGQAPGSGGGGAYGAGVATGGTGANGLLEIWW